MTMQQRTLVELKDLLGIEYACSHCHAKYLVPVERFDRIIGRCPNCQEILVRTDHPDTKKGSDEYALRTFVDALLDLRARGMGIRFDISPATEKRELP